MALKIIFMGTPEFAVPILQSLKNSQHKIIKVYTQPPKKKDRGQKIHHNPIHEFSIQNNLEIRHPEKLDTNEEIELIKSLNPDIIIVAAYGKLLPDSILRIDNIKFINVHASLLPKWRGAAPIQRAIMNLDNETGISIMKITSKLDAGPVLMKTKIPILKSTNFEELSKKLSNLGAKMILESLELIINKKKSFEPQNDKEASYAHKIIKTETKINWSETAEKIIAKINALYPKPGTWIEYQGIRLKILKAAEVKATGKPGEIIDGKFTIACSKNAIRILEIQKEGKKKLDISEYLKGNKVKKGTYAK